MAILHGDSLGSPTWMVDGHSESGHEERRLFLSRYDLGTELRSSAVQPGLDFSESESELFAGQEMGEDALRLRSDYLELLAPIRQRLHGQDPILSAAGRWERKDRRDRCKRKKISRANLPTDPFRDADV